MRTLRFHEHLYSNRAIEESLQVFAEHAELERRNAPPYIEIIVRPKDPATEETLAGELVNYVLALTVEESREGGQ